jgi:hypothetical protein
MADDARLGENDGTKDPSLRSSGVRRNSGDVEGAVEAELNGRWH